MSTFTQSLLTWSDGVDRPMPWRGIRDPYRIWLSEIILQQTRVAQGTAYYQRFVEVFPTVEDLASAAEDDVLSLWQGLGYYSRARNLHKAAKQVAEAGGGFPASYQELLGLPGVGPYSAAAIASFAYHEPVAVVDGNVYRVLARYFGIDLPINKPAGQRVFRKLADKHLAKDEPARYNQAIMDFGALVCTPKAPACTTCPMQATCDALATGRVTMLPVKAGKIRRRSRFFNYIMLQDATGAVALTKRGAGDIWQGLYDCPLFETSGGFAERQNLEQETLISGIRQATFVGASDVIKHVLSHQDLFARFYYYTLGVDQQLTLPPGFRWFSRAELAVLGISQLLKRVLEDRTLAFTFD